MSKIKFSIIIAVYNAEKYIGETIESVINQTVDFKTNTEIILVNDGSEDNSEVICKGYAKKYPDNIKYIYEENSGTSTARNAGIEVARGEYYNFLDSDDLLHECTLEKIEEFFKENPEVDMVTLPIECIDRQQGLYHRYVKFGDQSKVIDLMTAPKEYVFSSAASFYKAELFKKGLRFNTNLQLAEDLYLNTTLFLHNPQYGYISPNDAIYYYRKRFDNNSITNVNEYTDDWLVRTLEYVYQNLIKESQKYFEEIPEFLQHILIYNVVKRLDTPNFVSNEVLEKFYRICEDILSYVDDDIIIEYDYPNYYILIMMFMFKNKNYKAEDILYLDSRNNVCIKGRVIENIANYSFQISLIKIVDDKLLVHGYFNDVVVDNFKLKCINSETNQVVCEMDLDTTKNIFLQKRFFNTIVGKTYYASCEIPIKPGDNDYYFGINVNNTTVPLQLKNIYGDEGIIINQTYKMDDGRCDISISNQLINVSFEKNKK